MWKNKTCSVRSNWCHRAGVKILIVWVSRRYIFVLCAVICSGGWNSNKSSALQLGHPSTRGPWDLRSRCKEEWPAYVSRGGNDLPRPIQIFVAAEKNGPPAERHYHSAASILDFGPRLVNHCRVFHVYALLFSGSGLVKASFQRHGPQNEISIACAMLTPW